MAEESTRIVPVPLVAFTGWLLPGAGYWLLGQRARALTIGISIVTLYVAGLLIGGVRLIEVPGYGDHGLPLVVSGDRLVETDPTSSDDRPRALSSHPLDEIRNKPWYIAQVLVGPINLIASWGSVVASKVTAAGTTSGFRSHARTNELGVLYTAVAGMLNLLAIIDAASRAGQAEADA